MATYLLACIAFVALGLPDTALGVAWPDIRSTFALPQSGVGLIFLATSIGYASSSAASGWLVPRLGLGALLVWSTALVSIGVIGFATAQVLAMLLLAAVLVGLGSGAIDAGLNAHAASHFSARGMNWLHAAYGLGAATGPIVLTAAIASGGDYRAGYLTLAAALALLTLVFVPTRRRWAAAQPAPGAPRAGTRAGLGARGYLHIVAFFLYTGVELGVGQWSYAVAHEARGLSAAAAGTWTAVYWGSLLAGRVLVGFVANRIGPAQLVRYGAGLVALGALVFATAPMPLAGLGLALAGLAAGPIFPMLMTITAERFNPDVAARLVGFQVSAAVIGVLVLPTLGGVVADLTSLAVVPFLFVATAAALAVLCAGLTRR